MTFAFADLRAEYARLYASMKIDPDRIAEFGVEARQLFSVMPIYRGVQAQTGVPASVIAVIHNRESGRDFHTHLHNGDPLTARTYHVPAGRPPPPAQPPFTWTASAADALRYEGLDKITDWSIERAAYSLEAYNGFGYRQFHNEPSPYLWGATNVQQPGKYEADGLFNRTAFDTQLGCMPLLFILWQLDRSLALHFATPEVPPTPQPWEAKVWQMFPDARLAWFQSSFNSINPGSEPINQDGLDSPATIAAAKAFQLARGLIVDGKVGPQTAGEMQKVINLKGA